MNICLILHSDAEVSCSIICKPEAERAHCAIYVFPRLKAKEEERRYSCNCEIFCLLFYNLLLSIEEHIDAS